MFNMAILVSGLVGVANGRDDEWDCASLWLELLLSKGREQVKRHSISFLNCSLPDIKGLDRPHVDISIRIAINKVSLLHRPTLIFRDQNNFSAISTKHHHAEMR